MAGDGMSSFGYNPAQQFLCSFMYRCV